jgi:hypothetical protein
MNTHLRSAMLVLVIIATACSNEPAPADDPELDIATTTVAGEPADTEEVCESRATDVPWTSDVSATVVVLSEGGDTTPRVEAVAYPHPGYEGKPWSQWGQGLVLDDGRFLSAIGDHEGVDGNSYLFEYDPGTKTLTQIIDVLAITDHTPGDWGFGKIHAQMVRGPCDSVMVTTYWGTRRDIEYTAGYQGDVLINIDPQRRTVGTRGVMRPEHGVPSLAASPDGQLLYSEAVDPSGDDAGAFVVQEARDGTTIFVDDDPSHTGYRTVAVDADGRAFYSVGEGTLAVYDPESNTQSRLDAKLPGEWLRAVTEPDGQGTWYGVTRNPEVFFALSPDGTVRTLDEAIGYTTSIALSPDGTTLYSVPEAHGRSWEIGTPLMAVDTTTGEQEVVIELQPLAEEHLGVRLGGTYNVAIDKEGKTIYLGMNTSDTNDDSGFGEVVLIIVTLP